MNSVQLIGRLTADPEVRYTSQTQMAVTNFTLAVDRGKDKNGEDKGTDFIRIQAFGRQAETIEKYVHKGDRFGLTGRIQTGSYQNKNGETVYTTVVVVSNMDFLQPRDQNAAPQNAAPQQQEIAPDQDAFEALDEDVPF